MVENINFGKPKSVEVLCPRCGESNSLSIMTLGDIIARNLICKGCAREFKAFVHWEARTWTEKDFNDGTEKACSMAGSDFFIGSSHYQRYG